MTPDLACDPSEPCATFCCSF